MILDRGKDGGSHPRLPAEVIQRALVRVPERSVAGWENLLYEDANKTDDSFHLLEYWRIIYKHKYVIAGVITTALCLGLAVTLLTQRIYTAKATLEIESETVNVTGLQGTQPLEGTEQNAEFLETQYGLLRSRSLAERVVQSLANDPVFLETMGAAGAAKSHAVVPIIILSADSISEARPDSTPTNRLTAIANRVESGLGVNPVPNSRLVEITFDSPNPDLSARIANAFADSFIASNLERHFEATAYARHFLEDRLNQLRSKLEESERQLVAYATQKQIIQIGESGGKDAGPPQSLDATNLEAFNNALTAAKSARILAEQKWRSAEAASGLSVPDILSDPTIQALRQQKAQLLAQYVDQLKVYKPDYPQMLQLKARMDDIDQQIGMAGDTIRASLKTQYETALNQEKALEQKVQELTGSVLDVRNREIKYNILQREVDTNRTLYDGLLQRYKEIGVAGGVSANNVSVVDRAEPPSGPSRPRPIYNLGVAAVVGLGLGLLLAFLLEALDQAIRKPADVEDKLGVPVLGSVPMLEKGVQPQEALADPRSPFSEAYFSLRSTLNFSTNEGAPRLLAVTSARPGEGKTTTSIALAQGFARLGMRVLLMDLDLRNPGVHKVIGADNRLGVSNLLTGSADLDQAAQETEFPNLLVVPSGLLPPSPAELLAGSRLRQLLGEAADAFDVVILDTPPVMGLADAPLVAAAAVGTLLVIEAGQTSRTQALAAVKRLRMATAHVLGVVLSKFDASKAPYGYGYAYAYEYDYSYGRGHSETRSAIPLLRGKQAGKPRSAA